MDNKERDDLFGDDLGFTAKSNFEDFPSGAEVKNKTIDFLNSERDEEKTDVQNEKKLVDDFLNFNDDSYVQQQALPVLMPHTVEKANDEQLKFSEPDDEFLNPYAMTKEVNNEKFISSEDLISDFKDPIPEPEPAEEEEEIPKPAPAPVIQKSVEPEVKPKEIPKPAAAAQKSDDIEAEKIFKSIGLDAWFKKDRLHPQVESLIYWRDVKKSGVVFGIGMAILLAMSMFSLISVFAYISLLTLLGTVSFRVYKTVMSAVQKTSDGHPFKDVLDVDLTLSPERAQNIAGVVVTHINAYIAELRRLFLVEDLVDSLKFGLLLYLMTYIGAIFNGMTVVILAYVAMFTLPKVYETNKQNIDQYLDLVRSKIVEITDKVKAAIPLGKKEESAKDK